MSEYFNVHDFMEKVDYEGGPYSALEYGLTTAEYELPKHLVDTWNEIRDMFHDLNTLVEDFWTDMDKYAETVPRDDE